MTVTAHGISSEWKEVPADDYWNIHTSIVIIHSSVSELCVTLDDYFIHLMDIKPT